MDRAIYSAVAATPTPSLDEPLRRLSNAANNSRLWLAIATGLRVTGGQAGRRAAVRGTAAIGVTSALVNLAVKSAWSRQRPDRAGAGVPARRNVRMPGWLVGAAWSCRTKLLLPGQARRHGADPARVRAPPSC